MPEATLDFSPFGDEANLVREWFTSLAIGERQLVVEMAKNMEDPKKFIRYVHSELQQSAMTRK